MSIIKYIFVVGIAFASCNGTSEKSTEKVQISTEIKNGVASSTFKVWGNCEMCKETIVGSLKVDGIEKADWDVDSKIMSVTYDTSKISLDQIQKNIASVGYDNVVYRGNDSAYKNLPECCQYDRKK